MMVSIEVEENGDVAVVDEVKNLQDVKKNLNFKKKLIMQVRKHRSLYDNGHRLFSNVAKKELVWQQIAKELKVNVDDCKNTWIELRYGYQRHVRRLHNYFIKGHKKNLKRPIMYLETELMFLYRFIENRKTCNLQLDILEGTDLPAPDIVTEPQKPAKTIDVVENTPCNEILEKALTSNKEKEDENSTTEKKSKEDDDLILVEAPVECIVIDEDDDNGKSEKPFKITASMKLLISHIKTYPELYDSEHLAFKDYTRKSYIWNAIAGNLGDKATKLMKCWIVMQTRYEWELWQAKQNSNNTAPATLPPQSDLQVQLEFLRNHILNNPDTVYKQSYYLKTAWFDPIDYFKDIYNLIVRMKKMSDIVHVTDSHLNNPEKSKQYLTLWSDIANLKGCTAGQCETTWLIMRHFYWELMYMRQQNYQLTDKWYFETIITELYAISKTAQTAKQQEQKVLKQYKPMKTTNKRPAQTSAETLGAPSANRVATTMQLTPTIINNLQSVPATNSTLTTQSTAVQPITYPKITAAVSLAPQALNTGSLQIKQIPGPPTLAPAPQPHNTFNAMPATPITAAYATPPSMVPTQMPIPSFNLQAQANVTTVHMPSLIRPLGPNTTQPIIKNTPATHISVRPRIVLRPPPPPIAPKIQITPLANTATTTISSTINPQITGSIQPSPLASSSGGYNTPPSQPAPSVTSFKITTLPSNSTTPVAETAPSSTTTNTSQLPKISGAISLLNPNEILIELIASQNGNQLVVHGPPLTAKYQLSMPTVAKFIREVLAIPLLHNKSSYQPGLNYYYWEHIGRRFSLPVHICRACWNFLLENFVHFPQIAPLKELMKPFHTTLDVWKESSMLFRKFDDHCVSKGWLQYMSRLPEVVECISGYPVLYQDVSKEDNKEKLSNMETLCAWRTISLRFPKIPEIEEIWNSIKTCFCRYMTELEFGINNKWPLNWWRALARLKFLVEARYSPNEPFYYIVSNKMVEEIEQCAMLELKNRYKDDKIIPKLEYDKIEAEIAKDSAKNIDIVASIMNENSTGRKEVELGTLLTVTLKHPAIFGKADNVAKYEAWKKVAKELRMEVTDCLLAFKKATQMYFAYKKQDPVSRCRVNERYYKKFDEIVRSQPSSKSSTSRCKLNIKTPLELNQSFETENSSNTSDLIFPERYISDISMSNSHSNLVVKNWVYAIGNLGAHFGETSNAKLKAILNKYIK